MSIPKIWKYNQKKIADPNNQLAQYSPLIQRILSLRGLTRHEEIVSFLEGQYEKERISPFVFLDMEKCVTLLISHIKAGNKITIYGDYDADGVSSSVLLSDVLRILHANIDFYIPDRVTEGYGLNREAIDGIVKGGTRLIITVDNGIRNKEEVGYIKEKGLEVIITDHHQGPDDPNDYPDCPIINPALPREKISFRKFAGVGVALKVAEALLEKSTLTQDIRLRIRDSLLDLAAIGTIADCVSLLGENRLMVRKGLMEIGRTKRTGLKELMKISNIKPDGEVDSWNIGFQIAPRINAAGRMDHANTAFALLMAKTQDEANRLAAELDHNNRMRQKSTEDILQKVEAQLMDRSEHLLLSAVYDYEPGEEHEPWNEGIIGLVAGKITEKHYRPSLIITKTEDGYKGSGRSIPEFDIVKALEACAHTLRKYGGHPMACGFSLEADQLEAFLAGMQTEAKKILTGLDLRPKIDIDEILEFSDIDEKLAIDLSVLRPFGQDNPQPVFMSRNIQVVDIINLGANGQHLKLRLKNGQSRLLPAIGFGQTEKWPDIRIGDQIDIAYHLELNEYGGRREPQLRIIDIKETETHV
jgi:single-stranded-DNA-specific exonuclease